MPEQDLHGSVALALFWPSVEMAAAAPSRQAAYCVTQLRESRGDDAQHLVLSLRVRRRRLRKRKTLEELDERGPVPVEVGRHALSQRSFHAATA